MNQSTAHFLDHIRIRQEMRIVSVATAGDRTSFVLPPNNCDNSAPKSQSVSDFATFKTLYTRLFPLLCQKAYAYTRDADAAKDIVQEVFVRYWTTQPQITASSDSYLYRAVINQCLNYIDAGKRRSAATLNYIHITQASTENTEETVRARELEEQIDRIIQSLPVVCRRVFLLSRYEGMNHQQIADQLNISPNTVDNHIKRALKTFRENFPDF
jgi:RNA polymerase sigma-70 factor (ECF subfamily)